ncbi:hypothetical protein BDQ12DRAFT_648526 [Crucibulum laeve]|uniref:Uncharacterized protein n=1 Tax=Crucibulum laeve TaxID=68775 RepID=A0A5C3M460_9AGAR|nr:hypothetical protein BDQ12DRAFT_648526 [Crucibulum laeve]
MQRTQGTRSRTRECAQVLSERGNHSHALPDDNEWTDDEKPRRPSSPTPSLRSGTPRKRRPLHKTTYIAGGSPRKQTSIPPSSKRSIASKQVTPSITPPLNPTIPAAPAITKEEVMNGAAHGAVFTIHYIFDIVATSIHLLRKPLSLLLFVWLLALIISRISQTLRGAFAPLCIIPGISSSSLCRIDVPSDGRRTPKWADYPSMIEVQSKTFEQLLEETVGGSGLSLEIKKAEMATTDLVTLVRVSDLKTRDVLADSLMDFVDDAKKTGRGLQKLSSKVGGAVDNIMAVNDWALHTIESAHANAPSMLSSLIPWSSSRPANEVITETFSEAMNVLSSNMQRLILEAEVNLADLNALEERLLTIHEIVTREDSTLSVAHSELLSALMTKFGGNRRTLRSFEQNLFLLKGLGEYRKQALVHVVAALQTLRSMSDDMEDLRERVAAPDLVGSKIPVEVHMKSIKIGLERLKEGRIKAKSLEEDAVRRVLSIGPDDDDMERTPRRIGR